MSFIARAAAMALLLPLSACADGAAPTPPASLALRVVFMPASPRPGDTVRVALDAGGNGALDGTIRFDPGQLAYGGVSGAFAAVNEDSASQGALRVLAVGGVSEAALVLRFVARQAGVPAVEFAGSVAEIDGVLSRAAAEAEPGFVPASTPPIPATRALPAAVIRRPGVLRYGDLDANGRVDVMDAVRLGNYVVGNPVDVFLGAGDFALAANPYPFNLPGAGAGDDDLPPGRDADGHGRINVLDVAMIARRAVGLPLPIVGETVPASRRAAP